LNAPESASAPARVSFLKPIACAYALGGSNGAAYLECWQFQMQQDFFDDDRVGQEGKHDHGDVAPGAGEGVQVEDAFMQAGPGTPD